MILTFHKVARESPSIWWVTTDKFGLILDQLSGKKFVSLDGYDPLDTEQVVITFDGPYKCILEYAVPELERRSIPFEVFVIGDFIGLDNKFDSSEPLTDFCDMNDLRTIKKAGGKLQWHTRTHSLRPEATIDEINKELTVPDELLAAFPDDFKHFAYPHGEATPRVRKLVETKFSKAVASDVGDQSNLHNLPRESVYPDSDFSQSTVTVLLMNYNYRHFCLEAYKSVVQQHSPPDRFIVIDDASTDGSRDIIERFMPEARTIINEQNLGIVDNFNQSLNLLETDYALFLGADNYLHPSAIQKLKMALDSNPKAAIAYFDMVLFGPLASQLAETVSAPQIGESITDGTSLFLWQFRDFDAHSREQLRKENYINGSSMFRVKAFRAVGGYQKTYPEDHNLWVRIIDKGHDAIRVPLPLLYYRQHSTRQANTVLGIQAEMLAWRRRAMQFEGALANPHGRFLAWLEIWSRPLRNVIGKQILQSSMSPNHLIAKLGRTLQKILFER